MTRTLQAILFDFDGLITDTETASLQSWRELYAEYGVELPLEEWLKVVGSEFGPETFLPVDYLEARVDEPIDWAGAEERRLQREKVIVDHLPALPGVEALIADAQANGVRLAVGSSSPHAWVDRHLTRLGLFSAFDAVICADDVEQVKPAPDLFYKAAAAVGVEPHQAVVLEDSANGIQAALSAGIFSVAVPGGLTRHLDFSRAGMRVQSLEELSVDLLNKALTNHHQARRS